MVVAPSLTPDCYNCGVCDVACCAVVAPSLTPDCYNLISSKPACTLVVAPSLTPDCYNRLLRDLLQVWPVAGFRFRKTVLEKHNLGRVDLFFLKKRQADEQLHAGVLFFRDRQDSNRTLGR